LRIACPEEIALRQGYISLQAFEKAAEKNAKSSYGEYLKSVALSYEC
jgi:glucose-1-phosphate thymidylyltransferase